MLGGFAGATEENLYLADVVVRDCEIGIEGYRAFKGDQCLIQVFPQPFEHVPLKVGGQRVVRFDR